MNRVGDGQSQHRQSRFRSWAGWLPLLGFVGAVLVGYRLWSDQMEQSRITEVHASFLNFMAERSPKAREYRSSYYRKFGRDTVASKHFEQVCAVMYRSARSDNVDPSEHSELMAKGCRAFGRKHPSAELPS
jgi:hypothetical protein